MTARPHVRRNLLWIDLETTGLDPAADTILEVGVILTTPELVELGRWSSAIRPRGELRMTQYAWQQHAKSGLLDECKASDMFVGGATWRVERLVEQHCSGNMPIGPSEKPMIAGSSVHFDRSFVAVHMRSLLEFVHYRQIDVSGMREDARNMGFPLEDENPDAELPHRVIPDLEASIALLKRIRAEVYRDR